MGAFTNGLFVAGTVAVGSLIAGAAETGVICFAGKPENEAVAARENPITHVCIASVRNVIGTTLLVLPPAYALLRVMHTS